MNSRKTPLRVCLLSTGQPSTNPRLVKEADALSEEGYEVRVIASWWVAWAHEQDKKYLKTKQWRCQYVGGFESKRDLKFFSTWLVFRVMRGLVSLLGPKVPGSIFAISRTTGALIQAAQKYKADLYIGHNLGALPAAVFAAKKHHAKCGFDIEDYHSGEFTKNSDQWKFNRLVRFVESKYLPRCDYLTAASPLIAEKYKEVYGLVLPTTILNVFPLSERSRKLNADQEKITRPSLYWFSQTIGQHRGLESAIRGLKLMRHNTHLYIRGEFHDLSWKKHLTKLAHQSGVMSRVHFLPPRAPNEMVGLSMAHDIGLCIEVGATESSRVALSNKLFTFVLAGLPIVMSATEAHKYIVHELKEVTRIVAKDDPVRLAKAVDELLDESTLDISKKAMAAYGRERYHWDLEKKKLLTIVKNVIGDPTS